MASILNKFDNKTKEHLKKMIEIVKRKIIKKIEIYLSILKLIHFYTKLHLVTPNEKLPQN